jgi:hypothetical protein
VPPPFSFMRTVPLDHIAPVRARTEVVREAHRSRGKVHAFSETHPGHRQLSHLLGAELDAIAFDAGGEVGSLFDSMIPPLLGTNGLAAVTPVSAIKDGPVSHGQTNRPSVPGLDQGLPRAPDQPHKGGAMRYATRLSCSPSSERSQRKAAAVAHLI